MGTGTGVKAALGDGQPVVAGKTGTSQVSHASSEGAQDSLTWEERDHALFVAFVPANDPRYAVAAIIEHGGGGGASAAPLVRDCIEAVLEAYPIAKHTKERTRSSDGPVNIEASLPSKQKG